MKLAGLFDYSQRGGVFTLARDGVQYPKFFLFTQELFHFTQEILPLLPKILRTPYSRINPFYSRNFTFITQEITNTLLKKFEGP